MGKSGAEPSQGAEAEAEKAVWKQGARGQGGGGYESTEIEGLSRSGAWDFARAGDTAVKGKSKVGVAPTLMTHCTKSSQAA